MNRREDHPTGFDFLNIEWGIEKELVQRLECKTRGNSNFMRKGKMVIYVKIRNLSRSQMTKQTSLLESSREI